MRNKHTVQLVMSALLLWPLWAITTVAQGVDLPPAEDPASLTIYDTTPPDTGAITVPALLQSGPIAVSYSGVEDDGAGLKSVALWVRRGPDEPWEDTGLSSEDPEGAFEYPAENGDGVYEFALVAEDEAGNVSELPEGPVDARTTLDSTPPVITLLPAGSAINMVLYVNEPFIDPGATAHDEVDGDLSNQVSVTGSVDSSTIGAYTLSYNVSDAAGNAAEQKQRVVEVRPRPAFALTVLPPQFGSMQASPAPNASGLYELGTMVTLQYQGPPNSDFVVQDWNGADINPENPTLATVEMNTHRIVSIALSRPGGTVAVNVTPQTAPWVVTDSTGARHTGTGDRQLRHIPAGEVSIAFNALAGYMAPSSQTRSLQLDGLVTFTASYQPEGDFTVSVPSGLPADPGDTVTVPVNLSNRNGLASYSVTLSFEADDVAFEDLAAGSLVAAWGAPTVSPAAGAITISGSGPALSAGSGGTLATVTLRVQDDARSGPSALTVSGVSLNQGGIPARTISGSILIGIDQWVWGDVDDNDRADAIDANLILGHVVGRDQTLPFQDKAGDPSFAGPANVKGAEPPTITIKDAFLIYGMVAGRFHTFPADLTGDGFGPDLGLTDKEVELPMEIVATRGEQRVIRTPGSVIVEPGVEVRVPVSIDSATGVFGYLLEMQYDPAILEFRNVSKGALAEPWIEPVFHSEDGMLRWAATGAERLSGAGQLSVVTFRGRPGIAPSTNAALTLARAELNDTLIITAVEAGAGAPELESVTPARGPLDGYSAITLRGANLANVDTVLIGGTPAAHVSYDPRNATLRAITPPRGSAGAVAITVSALGQESSLEGAFEYYQPEIHLSLEPADFVYVGEFFEIPIIVTNRAQGVTRLSFVLNFDADVFARATTDAVEIGRDGGNLQVTNVQSVGAGRLSVTLEGPISNGHLCTINLVTMSVIDNPDSLVFVTDGQATAGGAAKDVSGGSLLPARGGW